MQSSDNCVVAAIAIVIWRKKQRNYLVFILLTSLNLPTTLQSMAFQNMMARSALKPFKVIGSADMSFQQKLVGLDGACKSTTFFCHCCECDCKTD
eukprot:scaffold39661_cov63-Cyclotella_meneghiniana.AAC.8